MSVQIGNRIQQNAITQNMHPRDRFRIEYDEEKKIQRKTRKKKIKKMTGRRKKRNNKLCTDMLENKNEKKKVKIMATATMLSQKGFDFVSG